MRPQTSGLNGLASLREVQAIGEARSEGNARAPAARSRGRDSADFAGFTAQGVEVAVELQVAVE